MMKKIVGILALAALFVSCEDDVKTNSPAFQGEKQNEFWKANDSRVTVNPGNTITISGFTDKEKIAVTVPNAVGVYTLGTNGVSNGTYEYNFDGVYKLYETRQQVGLVSHLIIDHQGTGYTSLDGETVETTGGTGVGLKVKLDVNGAGNVSDVSIVSTGRGYVVGDFVTAVGGNNNAVFKVITVTTSNGSGEVTIEKIENGTYTGTIKFNATDDDENVVNFNNGIFYKVPKY